MGDIHTNDYSTIWYVLYNGDNIGNMERGFKFDYRFQEQGILWKIGEWIAQPGRGTDNAQSRRAWKLKVMGYSKY